MRSRKFSKNQWSSKYSSATIDFFCFHLWHFVGQGSFPMVYWWPTASSKSPHGPKHMEVTLSYEQLTRHSCVVDVEETTSDEVQLKPGRCSCQLRIFVNFCQVWVFEVRCVAPPYLSTQQWLVARCDERNQEKYPKRNQSSQWHKCVTLLIQKDHLHLKIEDETSTFSQMLSPQVLTCCHKYADMLSPSRCCPYGIQSMSRLAKSY